MVERGHLQPAEALVERVLAHERVELGGDRRGGSERQVGLDAVAEAGEAELLEPRDLRLGEARVADVRERRAAPELQRPAEGRRGRGRVAARERLAPASRRGLEAVGVELGRARGVAAALVGDEVVARRRAQARREHLDGGARVLRRSLLPELVDDPVDVQCGAVAGEQQGEERERAPARHVRSAPARQLDLDRAEDPHLRAHPGASLSRPRAQKAI